MREKTQIKIDAMLEEVRRETGVPGVALCVERAGSRWFSASGTAKAGTDEPVTRQARFDVSCLMKFFLSVTALKLAAQERLDLQEDVTTFLPELGDRRAISLMHLMSHASGYHGADITDMNVRWASKWQAFASRFRDAAQLFTPGTTFNYEHTEHVILGEVLRRLFSKAPSEMVHENLLSAAGVQLQDAGLGNAGISAHGFSAQRSEYVPTKLPPFGPFWEASLPAMTITLEEIRSSVQVALADKRINSGLCEPRISLPKMARSEARAELPPQQFSAACGLYEGSVLGHNGSMFGQTVGFRFDTVSGTLAVVGVNAYSAHARDTALRRALSLFADREEQRSPSRDQPSRHSQEDVFGDLAPSDTVGRYIGSYLGEVTIERDGADLRVTVGPSGKRQSSFKIIGEDNHYTIASRMPVAMRFQKTQGAPALFLGVHAYRASTAHNSDRRTEL
jgi:CubicO group peptidase (beta-lactamase class C family)